MQAISPEKVVLRAKKGTFALKIGSEHYIEGTVRGVKQRKDLGQFDGERLPGSGQNRMPKFDQSLGQFAIYKEDGTLATQKDADRWVEKYKLTYTWPEYDKRKDGQPITHANIHDMYDPFFNHRDFIVMMKDGEVAIDKNGYRSEVILGAIKGDKEVQHASSDSRNAANVLYVLTDKNTDIEMASQDRKAKLDAYRLFETLDLNRKKMILRALGRSVKEDEDPRIIDEVLFSYVEDNTTRKGGLSHQKMFLKFARMSPEDLKMKDLIMRAEFKGHLRRSKGMINFQGSPIGATLDAVERFFNDPQNYYHYEALVLLTDGEHITPPEERVRKENLAQAEVEDEIEDTTEEEVKPKRGRPKKS